MVRALLTLALLVAGGCASPSPTISPESPPPRARSELPEPYAGLQGVWTVTRAQDWLFTMPDKVGTRMHFEGNRFWFDGDRGFEVIEIDTTAEPFKIDFWSAGTAVQGIFEIVGETLFICSAAPGYPRPTHFDPSAHHRYILSEAERTTGVD